MRIAIISDIHSNNFYLEAVLQRINELCVDEIYCLGDLIGYFDKPNHVIELIRKNDIHCIKGNHEKYLLGEITCDKYQEDIFGLQRQKELLSSKNYRYINELPDYIEKEIEGNKVLFCHSFPNDTSSYIRSAFDLDSINLRRYKYYCFGHTHIPLISYHYGTCIINPGSVGQPRDYTQKPSFAMIDTESIECTLYKIDLDISHYLSQLKDLGYAESLIAILERTP